MLFGWIAFVAVAVALGASAGTNSIPRHASTTGESARADHALAAAGLQTAPEEVVLVQSIGLAPSTAELYTTVRDVTKRLSHFDDVQQLRSPLAGGNGSGNLISWDLRSALVPFRVRGNPDQAAKRVQPMLDAVAAVQRAHPALLVSAFGNASSARALDKTIGKDFRRAELTTVPLTLAILLVAFGALVMAGVSVLLAFTGVLAAIGLAGATSHVFPISGDTNSVILLVGMALGIDYSLFYIRREREGREAGLPRAMALAEAARTSGQTVLVSGLTVLVAMAGMFFSGSRIFTSFAIGTMLIVAITLVGALTVLPALLGKFGDRFEKGRIRFGRRRAVNGESRVWGFVLARVLRRPALAAAVSAGALLALAAPALHLHTQFPGYSDLPPSLGFAKTHDRIQIAFGTPEFVGAQTPAVVVVEADDVTAPRVRDAIRKLGRIGLATGQMVGPTRIRVNGAHTVAAVSLSLKGTGNDPTSKRALATLRNRVIPGTTGRLAGVTTTVTGTTAATSDFNTTMLHHMPLVFGFALALVFVLLLVSFRSIVIPIQAVVLNLLSVGAAYGVLVAVFQSHWAEGLLGFRSNGAIVSWLPMFLFVILFGISMDYHVFILSRIKELVDGGMDTDTAVGVGIRKSATVVTSAAAVMVGVFAIFATLNALEMKQMGVGLGVAILLDATLVRAVLLPATMKLLGEWNWYLPRSLEWLPRLHGAPRAAGQASFDATTPEPA